ncbi:acetyl-CoA acetyltransferase [Clostridium homopropionicum DSM 5847]|uniref:acetyl-CoA C-acetyltransferase n=1 Tax=Clostridium homopropionicum DSM 5847 TaxID=1121318 RepID=A0A0L6Z643_9CLOT|nr:acetyl-CoA C-acetyltransferase [Clostridium homopropionicum]KOA18268.1 acetyl-CoA acetyltransferase [Clostridium homopropionicum DSM 5847]SFF70141.1 acetyl-CoA C-acetyltransferase [Clostridium homopropionicum]
MREVVIVSAARTPIGKIGGALKGFKATELGGIAIKEAVKRAVIDPSTVDYAYVGQVLQGGCGQIPSRQATVKGGLPYEVPSITIGKVCSSGINAINLANIKILSGQADIVVAAGMESMSNAPYFLPNMRWGNKMGDVKAKDLMMHDGLWCSFYDRHMAVHGSEVAAEYGISRQVQDEWAVRSQDLAISAIKGGRLKEEIVPVEIKSKKGVTVFDTDEGPREGTTLEALAKLPPVFTKDGSVTAGNAPGVNDGGAALVLMSKEKAMSLGLKPLATIIDYAEVSQDPKYIATVPGLSTVKLLNKNNLTIDQIKLFEVNEAFAAVALVSGQIAKWDPNKVNVDGGAIAFGHPIGASGARIVMHLIYALRAQGGGYGVAAICSGAAQGDAILIKVD